MQCACCRLTGDGDLLHPLYHGLNCADFSGARIRRHSFVQHCLADLLRRLFGGYAVTTEVHLETPGSATVVADIALQTFSQPCDMTSLAAARVDEVEKRARYRAVLTLRGQADTAFIPFMVEATGWLGSAAVRFSAARLQTLIATSNAIATGAFSRGIRVVG